MSTRQAAASFSEAGARDTLNWRYIKLEIKLSSYYVSILVVYT